MRFLIDMNLSPRWQKLLQSDGFESFHWSEIGNPAAPDEEIVEYAISHRLVIFTHDLDFGAIVSRRSLNWPSVVQLREGDSSPDRIGIPAISAIRQCQAELEKGAIVTIDMRRSRARILPISLDQ